MRRLRLIPDKTKIKFMRGRFMGLIVSAVLSIGSVILFFYPGLNYGVDFNGGTVVQVRMLKPADFATLRPALNGLGLGQVQLQQFGTPRDVLVRLEKQSGAGGEEHAVSVLRHEFATRYPGSDIESVQAVGATVSAQLFRDGLMAVGLALVAMLIYIWFRFEWQFGVGAVTTLILDVTKTIGFFAVIGLQFNLTSIAAILTIMGYSINDKVVVYDRVRENLRKYKTMPLRELIDLSINETLNRTVNTSLTTFLATLPLALVGGSAIQGFAIVILFGIVVGTSSSIFIAAPILLFLGQNRLRRGQPSENRVADRTPA